MVRQFVNARTLRTEAGIRVCVRQRGAFWPPLQTLTENIIRRILYRSRCKAMRLLTWYVVMKVQMDRWIELGRALPEPIKDSHALKSEIGRDRFHLGFFRDLVCTASILVPANHVFHALM